MLPTLGSVGVGGRGVSDGVTVAETVAVEVGVEPVGVGVTVVVIVGVGVGVPPPVPTVTPRVPVTSGTMLTTLPSGLMTGTLSAVNTMVAVPLATACSEM